MAEKRDNLSSVRHVLLVLSGKGGVGKSTVATQLSLVLSQRGLKVGLLDIDLCGPSIPKMLNVDGQDVHQCSEGWVPVFVDKDQRLAVMSIGFLLKNNKDAVVWRGPKKNAMIKQFVNDVYWRDLDYLVIDTPPGTSDEHISIVESLRPHPHTSAVLVTTPQIQTKFRGLDQSYALDSAVSTGDVRRELTFCKKTGVALLGIIENMSGFVCPHCTECTNVFSKGGGEALANQLHVPFLGCIPLEPELARSLEAGRGNFLDLFPHSSANEAIQLITGQIQDKCEQSQKMAGV